MAALLISFGAPHHSQNAAAAALQLAQQGDLSQATAFIRGLKLNDNLPQLIIRTALQSPTIQNYDSLHGGTPVFNALNAGTEAAVAKYGGQWTENLAKASAAHFTTTELASLLADGQASPQKEKFERKKPDVGNAMRDLSTDLLSEATSDAVTHVVESFQKN
mgnify:CR=1 FL=1